MGAAAGESGIPLYDHAMRLHLASPDAPFHRDGCPLPDLADHPRSRDRSRDRSSAAPAVVAAYFADPSARPAGVVGALHTAGWHPDSGEGIAAVVGRADPARARRTGRWLVRHSADRCAVSVGLAVLGTVAKPADVPLIQTIGLLSHHFGPGAVRALVRLDPHALLWLADRVGGWGRVHAVEALCALADDPVIRRWLRRRAVVGDHLGRYYAGTVAVAAALHEVADDPDLADHLGTVLATMAEAENMGATLDRYEHAVPVLRAHLRQLAHRELTRARFDTASVIAAHLAAGGTRWPGDLAEGYAAVLARGTGVSRL
ncbi:hypothetical protein ACFPM7_11815 [Actinokineospora guangxiensis]|uniref:HEAT repeat protein n=1 Tax=Actinokineospora guangxiensis TaxID=1490288 RepID=A0ABW0EJX4_9PSEU